jgi:hypothetical protein
MEKHYTELHLTELIDLRRRWELTDDLERLRNENPRVYALALAATAKKQEESGKQLTKPTRSKR